MQNNQITQDPNIHITMSKSEREGDAILIQGNKFRKGSIDELDEFYDVLTEELMTEILSFHKTIPGYEKTPLVRLSALANSSGIGDIFVKDESHRFGLKAYKVLGGSYGILKNIERKLQTLKQARNQQIISKFV